MTEYKRPQQPEQTKMLSAKLNQAGAPNKVSSFDVQLRDWFKKHSRKMQTLAGSKEEANKIITSLIFVAQRNPKLMTCTMESIGECLMQSAQLKLYPGPLQECAYVPFGNRATFMPQYQGLCKLAYNSGVVRSIATEVVYANDLFEFELGTNAYLRHVPTLSDNRGERIAAWCVVKTTHGEVIIVKPISFIEGIRKRSPAGNKKDSPWNTSDDDYDAMARKTVLKQALKTIPKSSDLAAAIQVDNAVESGSVDNVVTHIEPVTDPTPEETKE
ncbi:hypothetical protein D6827_03435 [Candidatus Parcubacteria bacterium]|nr:MAG: hypothetical protein D6827_03435 [Candidatus Parcubacteria bacterium]